MYKILIVEDDLVIARKTAQFLETWGYETRFAEVFDRILETVDEWNPDLVIMDVNLPYRNGFEWTRQIRLHSKVPILFLSSADDAMNIVTAVSQGADDYMTKPFDWGCPVLFLSTRTYGSRAVNCRLPLRWNTSNSWAPEETSSSCPFPSAWS